MGKKITQQRLKILPILGLLFATIFTPFLTLPAQADELNTSNTTESQPSQDHSTIFNEESQALLENRNTTSDNSTPISLPAVDNDDDDPAPDDEDNEEEEANNNETPVEKPSCYEVVSSLSWIICPVVSVTSSGVDALYGIINNFLTIKPITSNEDSSIYIVWSVARDIANIAFIILILVVIFSHLTGFGFDNYNIKKTLPRIIIAAILVNLSFIICSLAVDISNIIGASTNSFFDSITTAVQNNSRQELSWADIIGRITGTSVAGIAGVGIAAGAIALSGGVGHFIWLVIPVVVGAIISLAVGVFTIALRQAVVALLVMIAPLAFVAYLLPNTEQYFKRWKDILLQMLVFFPMFALLYGASRLAGWTFITNGDQNNNIFEILIGMAIQVFPLIFSFKLLKMSNTILGKVSDTLTNLSQPLRTGVSTFSAARAATAKAKYDANNLSRPYTGIDRLNPSRLRSYAAKRQFEMEENRKLAEDTRQKILQEYTIARQMNKTITFDENGRRILSAETKTKGMNEAMEIVMQNKEANLSLSAMELSRENALNQAGDYATVHHIKDEQLTRISARQADNWLDLKTESNAKRRNDIGDEQFYAKRVLEASRLREDGKPVNREAYESLIVRGGGISAVKNYDYDANNINDNSTASVIANAYDLTEAERQNEMKRFTTFLDTQSTRQVEVAIKDSMKAKDVNNLIAGLNNIYNRGDTDLVEQYVREYMNGNNLELGTEDANHLAFALLQMKKAPSLRRLGKFINVETRQYTNNKRGELSKIDESLKNITYDEYTLGVRNYIDKNGAAQEYHPKFDIISTLEGTPFKEIERTAMDALIQAEYKSGANGIGLDRIREIDKKILPQLVTAIPSYDSGSEPLISIIKYITGMGLKDGKWTSEKDNSLRKDVDPREFIYRTRQYLSSFTANDLIGMKSDMFNAVKAVFAREYILDHQDKNPDKLKGAAKEKAQNEIDAYFKAEFKKIFSKDKDVYTDYITGETRDGTGVLDQLRNGERSAYNGMKNPIRQILDLD